MTISPDVIDAIKDRVNIADLIGGSLALKRSGANHFARCPFHEDRTPSFSVAANKGFFHCFSCQRHGDHIDWLVEYLGIPWNEAVARLAELAGISLPDNEDSERIKAKARAAGILKRAAQWMHLGLVGSERPKHYVMEERKIHPELAARFQIGWAPKSLQDYTRTFSQAEIGVLVEAGLLGRGVDGRLYPKLGGRIIFPILDAAGAVVGFSGRALGDGQPKYMNSPDSQFFNKRNELFRAPEARSAARRSGRLLVTEGYFDVIALAGAGHSNAVAGMGTATTAENLESMFALADEVVFCFDGDKAGRMAAWKALLAAMPFIGTSDERKGCRLASFVFLPDGLDPDEFIRARGGDAFGKLLDDPTPLSVFFIESYRKKRAVEPMEKYSALLAQAARQIASIKDTMFRDGLATSLAGVFDVPVGQVVLAGGFAARRTKAARSLPPIPADALETIFLVNLLRRPDEVDCLAPDVELQMPGGTEIVSLLRNGGSVPALFENTPFWPMVERLLGSDIPDDNLSAVAGRIELAWVDRRLGAATQAQDKGAIRAMLTRKQEVRAKMREALEKA